MSNPVQITRNKAQEQSMFALYDVLTYLDMKQEIDVESIVSGICSLPYNDCPVYIKAIVIASIKNLNPIVTLLNAHMNKWTFDRLNRVEQAILLLSVAHFSYIGEKVEKSVVIDVAIKLAKMYLGPSDYKFVNAILDKVLVSE